MGRAKHINELISLKSECGSKRESSCENINKIMIIVLIV